LQNNEDNFYYKVYYDTVYLQLCLQMSYNISYFFMRSVLSFSEHSPCSLQYSNIFVIPIQKNKTNHCVVYWYLILDVREGVYAAFNPTPTGQDRMGQGRGWVKEYFGLSNIPILGLQHILFSLYMSSFFFKFVISQLVTTWWFVQVYNCKYLA